MGLVHARVATVHRNCLITVDVHAPASYLSARRTHSTKARCEELKSELSNNGFARGTDLGLGIETIFKSQERAGAKD